MTYPRTRTTAGAPGRCRSGTRRPSGTHTASTSPTRRSQRRRTAASTVAPGGTAAASATSAWATYRAGQGEHRQRSWTARREGGAVQVRRRHQSTSTTVAATPSGRSTVADANRPTRQESNTAPRPASRPPGLRRRLRRSRRRIAVNDRARTGASATTPQPQAQLSPAGRSRSSTAIIRTPPAVPPPSG